MKIINELSVAVLVAVVAIADGDGCPPISPKLTQLDLNEARGVFYTNERYFMRPQSDIICNRVRVSRGRSDQELSVEWIGYNHRSHVIVSGNLTETQVDPVGDPTLIRVQTGDKPSPADYLYRIIAASPPSSPVKWSVAYNCSLVAGGRPLQMMYVSSNQATLNTILLNAINVVLAEMGLNTKNLEVVDQSDRCPPPP